jgi:acetoin:2,6-dichlorophenolindophenol oxidoreductase subunit alpha
MSGKQACAKSKVGEGPSILECKTFKYTDSGSNLRLEKEEIDAWKKNKDPVEMFRQKLYARNILHDAHDADRKKKIEDKIKGAPGLCKELPGPGARGSL